MLADRELVDLGISFIALDGDHSANRAHVIAPVREDVMYLLLTFSVLEE